MNNAIKLIKEENAKKHRDMANSTAISVCEYFHELGINMIWTDGKDVILEKEEPTSPPAK